MSVVLKEKIIEVKNLNPENVALPREQKIDAQDDCREA